jgi:hypothetical protein
MTDNTPIGASEIISPPLPTDPAAAQAMRDQLAGDIEYMRDWKTNSDKQSTLGYLRWVATGNPPELWGAPPETPGDVHLQESDRAQAQLDAHTSALRNQFPDLTDQQIHQITNRRPILAWEKAEHERQYNAKVKDELFMERWRRGDSQARAELYRHAAARSLPVGDLDHIRAWEAVFPYPAESK